MKIFIAGGTGVIGRRVVPLLRSVGHDVTALSRSVQSDRVLEDLGARAVRGDVFTLPDFEADAVINLATSIPPASRTFLPGAWRKTTEIRRIGSSNLAQAAARAGAKRFIQESFGPVYPDRGDQWIDETTPLVPVRYNRAVVDAERNAQSFNGTWVILRFAFFYGPDSDFTKQIIGMVKRGWAASFGRPEGFISSVSHDDAAAAVVAALELPSGVYNVVDDEPLTKREFNDSLADALGVRRPRFLPAWTARLGGSLGGMLARSQRISNRKLREKSRWRPAYPSASDGWKAIIGS